MAARDPLSALDAERELRRRRAAVCVLFSADLDAGRSSGIVLPWNLVPLALTFLLLAGTGLATRALARQALDDGPATLAGCAALFSGYALFTAYERSAFAELAGGFWIPLVLLFAMRERNSSGPLVRRAFDGSTVLLALAIAGAWLSNPTVGVMACYLLAAVVLTLALSHDHGRRCCGLQ